MWPFTKTPNTGEAGIGYWTYLGTTCGKHSLKQHSYYSDAKHKDNIFLLGRVNLYVQSHMTSCVLEQSVRPGITS